MLNTEVVLMLYNYLPLRKLIKFELSFMYLRVSYGHKKPKSSPLYTFKVRPNFKEIQQFQIFCGRRTERQGNLRTNFNFTFELTVF